MINTINIALSGILSIKKQVGASAANVANMTTNGSLEDPENAPYRAVTTTQKSVTDNDGNGLGVKSDIIPKTTPFVPAYDPGSPFADEQGLVGTPNVNLAEEAVNISLAEHSFKANLKIIETASELSEELLRVFDDKA